LKLNNTIINNKNRITMNRNSLTPLDPFLEEIFGKSISDFIGSDFTLNQPSVNIIESDALYKIHLAVPGLEKSDFHIAIEKGYINISSTKEEKKEKTEEKPVKYTRREFSYQTFKRSFKLPENVDEDSVHAKYENGILKLDIEKKVEEDQVKTIEIG